MTSRVVLGTGALVVLTACPPAGDRAPAAAHRTSPLSVVLSEERALDPAVVGGAPGPQRDPAAASDGTDWLVVWTDARLGDETWIAGARLGSDGTALDPAGLVIARGPGRRGSPAVAWGGGAFLVAWQESAATSSNVQLLGARVGHDGTRLDPTPIVLGRASAPAGRTAVAYDGIDFRVAWSTCSSLGSSSAKCDLVLTTLDPSGAASSTLVSTQAASEPALPTLACEGETCLIAWSNAGTLTRGLFNRAGESLTSPRGMLATSSGGFAPSLARTSTGYALVFLQAQSASSDRALVGTRVESDGGVVDPTPYSIAPAGALDAPSVAFDGTRLVVGWETRAGGSSDVLALRLLPDGTPLDTPSLAVAVASGDQRSPVVVTSGSAALVAFTDTRSDPEGDVATARLVQGEVREPGGALVSRAAAREARPVVAFDGTGWLVAFESKPVGSGGGIYGLRLAHDLTPLDAEPFAIADGLDAKARPTVAACPGAGFWVAWEDYRSGNADVYLRHVSSEGAAGPEVAMATGAGAQLGAALACGSRGLVLAWHDDGQYSVRDRAVRALRLSTDGAPLDSTSLSVSLRTLGAAPTVAADDDGFVVAWPAVDAADHGVILASRLGPSGAPSPAAVVCDGPGARAGVSASADRAGAQVFFVDQRTGPARFRTARLAPTGEALDPCGVELPGTEGGLTGSAAFDGVRHVFVFGQSADAGLASVLIAPGGGALEGFSLSAEPGRFGPPQVACDGLGACLSVFEWEDPAAGNGRVRLRLLTSPPPAPSCTSPADCATGHCVDGVCCDSDCGGGSPLDCLACGVAAGAAIDGTCGPVVSGGLCRSGTGCDAAERCDGAHSACPADAPLADGAFCDDGSLCTLDDACLAGHCTGASVECVPQSSCMASTCNPATGSCQASQRPLGASCDDGNACTTGDQCVWGTCGGTSKVCPAPPCQAGSCDSYTGECKTSPWPDGSSCDDKSACTIADRCVNGACQPGPAVRCPPPDACHGEGLCDRATGSCVYAPLSDGAPCDDGDACTKKSACVAGVCSGSDAVICPGADACHEAGRCDPATGTCQAPVAKANGTSCSDQNACTKTDACQSGACVGGDQIVCPEATACREAGVCNPATGLCASRSKPLGTPCDDGDFCTQGDTCVAGECRAGVAPTCPPTEEACVRATCDRDAGQCGVVPAPDGTLCPDGHCTSGACVAVVAPPPPPPPVSGCGCGAADGAGLWALVAFVPWWRGRRARPVLQE